VRRRLPKSITQVCQQCFKGNWQEMLEFARSYNSDERYKNRNTPNLPNLTKIIGSRSRTKFWEQVLTYNKQGLIPVHKVFDLNNVDQLLTAIEHCRNGQTVDVLYQGESLGVLSPKLTNS